MKKSTYILILVAAAAILTLTLLPSKIPTPLPQDSIHKEYISDDACLECHGKGSDNPLLKGHPMDIEDCMSCHSKEMR